MQGVLASLVTVLTTAGLRTRRDAPGLIIYVAISRLQNSCVRCFCGAFNRHNFGQLVGRKLICGGVQFRFSSVSRTDTFTALFAKDGPGFGKVTKGGVCSFSGRGRISILCSPSCVNGCAGRRCSPQGLVDSAVKSRLGVTSGNEDSMCTVTPGPRDTVLSTKRTTGNTF